MKSPGVVLIGRVNVARFGALWLWMKEALMLVSSRALEIRSPVSNLRMLQGPLGVLDANRLW